jgi:hypothetical protein
MRYRDEFEMKDEAEWSKVKALHGSEWKDDCVRKSAHTASDE